MKSKIAEMDVATKTKVMVPRSGCLERYLLQNAPQRRNRRLLSAPVRNIPFGVRGRRRNRRETIMFIGLRPNLDRIVSPTPNRSPISPNRSRQTAHRSPAINQPSTSTSGQASRVYRRLTFSPSPARHVITSPPPADNSTIDLSFTDSFGLLSIDSD